MADAGQNHIQEISSRLDISANETSEAFKLLINVVFNYLFYDLNRKANDLVKTLLAEEGLLEENLSKRVKKNDAALREMMRRNKRMQKALADVSEHLRRGTQISGTDQVALPQQSYAFLTDTVRKLDADIKEDSSVQESTAVLLSEADAQLKAIEVGYYDWLFHTVQFGDEFYKFGHGIVDDLWTTGWQEMKKITIPTPPLPEQQRIADFLDTKCAEIDALTADIQTQIDTLEQYKRSVITETVTKGLNPDAEMKDSGIQWIGDMPAHWGVIRGKYILRYMQKPVRENDGVITCFRDGEVTLRSNRREDGFTMSDKEIGYQGIDVDDLVIHGMDGFAGAIGISDSRGKASPVLNVLDTDQCKRYIMYYLRSMAYSDVFLALATGIRVRSCDLRWNKLEELSYPVPPLDEQNAIVKHIGSVLSKADAVIADKKAQLATLDEYKKSLIFEYVTGKKEVPVS